MNINETYYVFMEGTFIEQINGKLVGNAQSYRDISFKYFNDEEYQGNVPVHFSLRVDVKMVKWGDFHSSDTDMVSEKLKATLEKFTLHNTQFVPVKFTGLTPDLMPPTERFLLNCYNIIDCLDIENCKVKISKRTGKVRGIETLALKESILNEIPEENRMMFRLEGQTDLILIHEKIATELKKDKYNALALCKVSEWDDMAKYKQDYQLGDDLGVPVDNL